MHDAAAERAGRSVATHAPSLFLTAASSSTASIIFCFCLLALMTPTPSASSTGTVTGPVVTAPQSQATPSSGRRCGLPCVQQGGSQAPRWRPSVLWLARRGRTHCM